MIRLEPLRLHHSFHLRILIWPLLLMGEVIHQLMSLLKQRQKVELLKKRFQVNKQDLDLRLDSIPGTPSLVVDRRES